MLRNVDVFLLSAGQFATNPTKLLSLPVTVPDKNSPYIVKDIDGVGPMKVDFATSEYAGWDGGFIHDHSAGMRNIVMKIGYKPKFSAGETIQDLRRALYRAMGPGMAVELRFYTGPTNTDTYRIKAHVESMDPVIFARDPEIQVSFMCDDPYFSSLSNVVVSGNTGSINDITSKVGTAPSGFVFLLSANASAGRVNLKTVGGDPSEKFIEWLGGVDAGDKLEITTIRGKKNVRVIPATGTPYIRVSGIASYSTLSLVVGPRDNKFFPTLNLDRVMPYTLTFMPKWNGI